MLTASADSLTDLALLDRIARRDASAVADLYDRHARLLYALTLRILRDGGEAEDVLQDVLLRVWEKADTYDPALGSPTAWLVRIARNRAIDRLRARQARPKTESGDGIFASIPADGDITPGPERAAVLSEAQRAVAAALRELAPDMRVLIEEAYFRGLSQSELSVKFGVPLGTVKTRIRTGMMVLRDRLQHVV